MKRQLHLMTNVLTDIFKHPVQLLIKRPVLLPNLACSLLAGTKDIQLLYALKMARSCNNQHISVKEMKRELQLYSRLVAPTQLYKCLVRCTFTRIGSQKKTEGSQCVIVRLDIECFWALHGMLQLNALRDCIAVEVIKMIHCGKMDTCKIELQKKT